MGARRRPRGGWSMSTSDIFDAKRASILWQTIKKEKYSSVKTVEQDAELLVEETGIATKAKGKGKSGSKSPRKVPLPTDTSLAAASKSGQEVLTTLNEDVESIIAGRKATAPAVTRKSE